MGIQRIYKSLFFVLVLNVPSEAVPLINLYWTQGINTICKHKTNQKRKKKKNPIQWPETILCGLNLIKQDYHNLPIVIILKTTKNAMEILFHQDVCIFLSLINDHSLAVTNILENTNKS